MAVINGQAQAVHAERGEKGGIVFAEEDIEKAVEEAVVAFDSQCGVQGPTLKRFRGGESGDEVFHIHPSTEARAFEEDLFAGAGDDIGALCLEEDVIVHVGFLGTGGGSAEEGGVITPGRLSHCVSVCG